MAAIFVDITLTAPAITPADLPKLVAAVAAAVPAGGVDGVVLGGRLPVWAYAALAHHFHPRPWVATFDPRLGGGVVVATHTPGVAVGDIVPTADATVVPVAF